jgi:hypothetical protein
MAIKNEATRQRWELFHRAIAHAKQSNISAMQEADATAGKPKRTRPVLSVAN